MKHSQYNKQPKNYAIASIIVFNMVDVPFNRDSAGGQISEPEEKLDFIKETINDFMRFAPGVYLEYFVIINANTDCELTKAYYREIDGTKTKYNTTIKVLDAPEEKYHGPFASRQALYHAYPNFRYYFTCDADCIPIKDNWYKDGIDKMCEDDEIGSIGAWMTVKPFQCPDHIEYTDVEGNVIPPPAVYYTSGFFSFIRGHIYQLFDQYWGKDWFTQGKCYRDYAVCEGELMFAHRIQQLGYKVADFNNEEMDAPLCWHVPDVLFPNATVGNQFVYPTKSKVSPFFHTYLKIHMPKEYKELIGYVEKYAKN
ncbi:hypothetical protein LCGC14_1221950 [marine sediment metagenome]|uniref:Uncharacterized protein n=1 Tax=marine sediment metagenome TaxID=412755 RepID=A0A0F9NTA6_9ZZZZ